MFFDPQCKPETKADPFKLGTLLSWLEGQPGTDPYCYDSNGTCLLSRYFTSMGYQHVHMFSDSFVHGVQIGPKTDRDTAQRHFWKNIAMLPYDFNLVACGVPRTFGGALDRARKLRARAE